LNKIKGVGILLEKATLKAKAMKRINNLYDKICSIEKLKLTVKDNYQVFPVAARSIDFVGYRFYHTHTLLRKSIKQDFARMLHYRKNPQSIASYNGWAIHSNSKHLLKKLLHEKV
jgi:hypothetical protein